MFLLQRPPSPSVETMRCSQANGSTQRAYKEKLPGLIRWKNHLTWLLLMRRNSSSTQLTLHNKGSIHMPISHFSWPSTKTKTPRYLNPFTYSRNSPLTHREQSTVFQQRPVVLNSQALDTLPCLTAPEDAACNCEDPTVLKHTFISREENKWDKWEQNSAEKSSTTEIIWKLVWLWMSGGLIRQQQCFWTLPEKCYWSEPSNQLTHSVGKWVSLMTDIQNIEELIVAVADAEERFFLWWEVTNFHQQSLWFPSLRCLHVTVTSSDTFIVIGLNDNSLSLTLGWC